MATCKRTYRGSYAVRTSPCDRDAGHLGFCQFVVLPPSVIREVVLVVGTLLIVALGWLRW